MKKNIQNHINTRNTFENFIIGESNNSAYVATIEVAKSLAKLYNPLCIYAKNGLGKTHLMHAVVNFIVKNNPKTSIVYTTAEIFIDESIKAIKNGKLIDFKKYYRDVDVLIVDNIHVFSRKERCQEELYHIFNELFSKNKQIIFTSDRNFSKIDEFSPKLISFSEWAFSLEIQSPDYKERCAILRQKAKSMNLTLSDEIYDLLGSRITNNIKNLETALIKICGYTMLVNNPISLEKAKKLLKDLFEQEVK